MFDKNVEVSANPLQQDEQTLFPLGSASYGRTRLLAWLLFGGFVICACASVILGILLWSAYTHEFVPYLRWQDALLASLCYLALIALGGCMLVVRFLYALHAGHRRGMVIVARDATELIVRDLSPKNLSGICSAMGTACACFVAGLAGLIPEMLLGWTLHLPPPVLVVLCTAVVILLGVIGLAITVVTAVALGIGMVGCISFCRRMGAPHAYPLIGQTHVRIDAGVLTVVSPGRPESTVDLGSLEEEDRERLLSILRCSGHLEEYKETEASLEEEERYTVLA